MRARACARVCVTKQSVGRFKERCRDSLADTE